MNRADWFNDSDFFDANGNPLYDTNWQDEDELRCDKMLQNGTDVHSARIFLLSLQIGRASCRERV